MALRCETVRDVVDLQSMQIFLQLKLIHLLLWDERQGKSPMEPPAFEMENC